MVIDPRSNDTATFRNEAMSFEVEGLMTGLRVRLYKASVDQNCISHHMLTGWN